MRRYKASFRAEPASGIAASAIRASFSVTLSAIPTTGNFRPCTATAGIRSIREQGGGIGVRTRRPGTAKPDERYQDTRTVEHVYLPLQEVRKVEFADPKRTKEDSA